MLANNYKAIGIHILVSILAGIISYVILDPSYLSTVRFTAIVSSFPYVILSFIFLKPIPKYSYLSTMFIFIVLVIIACFSLGGSRVVIIYWFTNAYADPLGDISYELYNTSNYGLLLSAMIPSFLMYLGLSLKILWLRITI